MSTFLDAVNRVLRINTVLSGDDDDISTFEDIQHRATLNLAQIAIQTTLSELTSSNLIPYEDTEGTITYVNGQRLYTLPSDFVRMVDQNPFLLVLDGSGNSANTTVQLYRGGEEALRRNILDYKTQSGSPLYFYFADGSTKQIGLFHVPDSSVAGTQVSFPYQKDVMVTVAADTLPFHTTAEDNAFIDMCARYFQFLFTNQPTENLEHDTIYRRAKATLINLMKPVKPNNKYGYHYG